MDKVGHCNCNHHRIAPLMIVLIGVSFLFSAFDVIGSGIVAIVWPILLIIAGLAKLSGPRCGCCGTAS